MSSANDDVPRWTAKQGQYLAYLYAYATLNGRAPAERDMETFFRCTAPSVHSMIKTLEREGLIRRQPGVARSIELLVVPSSCSSRPRRCRSSGAPHERPRPTRQNSCDAVLAVLLTRDRS